VPSKTNKPKDWDFDNAEIRPPVRGRRAIVSVAFPAEDFQVVAKTAEALGMKLSEFIREAAVSRTRQADSSPTTVIAGVSMGIVVEAKLAPVTKLAGLVEQVEDKEAVAV
jgi:hypothetical protein